METSEALLHLQLGVRASQDRGFLPMDPVSSRRFQVMVNDIAITTLRRLVTILCLEGIQTDLIVALDEDTPYVGLQVTDPATTLWMYPSTEAHEVVTRVFGGVRPEYASQRLLNYRILTLETLEMVLIEQLRLVLCITQPVL